MRFEEILKATPKEILERATTRALLRTMKWLKFEAAKDLSGELAVRLSLIRQRFRLSLRRGANTEGEVAFIADAIPAIILGTAKTPTGVRTGDHNWDQGFVADWRKLKKPRRVWQRLGRDRLPIAQAKIPVEKSATGIFESYAIRAQKRFLANLEHEISWAYRRWQ